MPLEDETTVPECRKHSIPTLYHLNIICDFYINSLSYSFLSEYHLSLVSVSWNEAEDMLHLFLHLRADPDTRKDTYGAWYSEAEGLACYIRNSLDQDVMLTLEFH